MSDPKNPDLPAICAALHMRLDQGIPVVNSRDVAEEFDKRRDNVLRDIDNLLSSPSMISSKLRRSYFREIVTADPYGRDQRSIDMTKDGLILLVMGWTGPKALRIKIRYIEAFNAMEQTIRDNYAGLLEIDKALSSMMDGQIKAMQSIKLVEYKVDSFASRYRPPRLEITSSTKSEHIRALSVMGGHCPCCGQARVLTEDTQVSPFAEFDHFYQNSRRDPAHTWLICKPCHKKFTTGSVARSDRAAEFTAYQNKRLRLPGAQPSLFLDP